MSNTPLYMTKSRIADLESLLSTSISQVLSGWASGANTVVVSAELVGEHDAKTDHKSVCFTAENDQIRFYFSSRTSAASLLDLPSEPGPMSDRLTPALTNRFVAGLCQAISKSECADFSIASQPDPLVLEEYELKRDVIARVSVNAAEFVLFLKRELAEALLGKPKLTAKGGLANRLACLKDETVQIDLLLDGTRMSLHDVKNLKKGQTLTLNAKVNDPLTVRTGENVVAKAFVGKKENHKALIITQ